MVSLRACPTPVPARPQGQQGPLGSREREAQRHQGGWPGGGKPSWVCPRLAPPEGSGALGTGRNPRGPGVSGSWRRFQGQEGQWASSAFGLGVVTWTTSPGDQGVTGPVWPRRAGRRERRLQGKPGGPDEPPTHPRECRGAVANLCQVTCPTRAAQPQVTRPYLPSSGTCCPRLAASGVRWGPEGVWGWGFRPKLWGLALEPQTHDAPPRQLSGSPPRDELGGWAAPEARGPPHAQPGPLSPRVRRSGDTGPVAPSFNWGAVRPSCVNPVCAHESYTCAHLSTLHPDGHSKCPCPGLGHGTGGAVRAGLACAPC